jgi:NADPH2:quinone reductase
MAHALSSIVIVTAGNEEKCGACDVLGADLSINYRELNFVKDVIAFTDGHGADGALDIIGGKFVGCNLKVIATDGRLVNIVFLHGSKVEVDLMPLMLKRLTITGSTLRARSVDFKAAIGAELKEKIWFLIETGETSPFIYATFSLDEAAQAHELMASSEHLGKVVLLT